MCNCCMRINVELKDPEMSEERKEELNLEKSMHLDEARAQRALMNELIKGYVAQYNKDEEFVAKLRPLLLQIDDPVSDDLDEEDDSAVGPAVAQFKPLSRTILIQYEDFGKGIPLPYFKYEQPGLDYFGSSLIQQLFVIANRINNLTYVYLYDDRLTGKDVNMMCNLRANYHLKILRNQIACPRLQYW